MYYSYVPVVITGPQGTTITLNTGWSVEDRSSLTDEQREQYEELRSQIIEYGSYEGTYYAYVPDDYPIGEQPEAINAVKLETLDPEVVQGLIAEGTWANSQRRIQSMLDLDFVPPVDSVGIREYLFTLQTSVRALGAVVQQIATTMQTSLLDANSEEASSLLALITSTNSILQELANSQSKLVQTYENAGLK